MIKIKLGWIKRHPKRYTVLLVLLVLAVAALLFINSLSGPDQGSVSQAPPSQAETAPVPYSSSGNYNGKYISFTYPQYYKISPSKLTGSYLEVFDAASTDGTDKSLSVGVIKESLGSDSGYVFRQQRPQQYQQQASRLGTTFVAADGTEVTGFLTHGDMVASVSVTGPAGQNLQADELGVASSLKWK